MTQHETLTPGAAARARRIAAALDACTEQRRAERRARLAHDQAREALADACALARNAGAPWQAIGDRLGVSGVQAYRIAAQSPHLPDTLLTATDPD